MSTQLESKPGNPFWLVFTSDTPVKEASDKFFTYYGAEPERMFTEQGMMWIGPVPEGKRKMHTLKEVSGSRTSTA